MRLGIVGAFVGGILLGAPALAGASSTSGNPNAGDVWVDNVGQPAGPGHEMDPHLACSNINLWGNGLADPSGAYTIDGWPPSGSQEQVYSAPWSYNQQTAGTQVISVIDVQKLVATAVAAGDAPINKQGFHFKLQFVQDPQKHKTFWVNCKAPQTKGDLKVCKMAATSAVTGNFQFSVEGKLYTVPVGGCSSSIQAPIGNVTITELARAGFALQAVSTSPSNRLVSDSLSAGTATVQVVAGGTTTQTVVTFTNKAVSTPTGVLEICKQASGTGLAGDVFSFSVAGKTYMVPVGACTAAITLPAGDATVTEMSRSGSTLVGIATIPTTRLVSSDLSSRTAVVRIVAGNVSHETVVTFTNKFLSGNGFLKICKVAGSGISVGTVFHFTVGSHTVSVPAGPAPGGYCVVVGKFPFGQQTIVESIPSGDHVSSIVVAPANRGVSSDPATGRSVVDIASGFTEATYTNMAG